LEEKANGLSLEGVHIFFGEEAYKVMPDVGEAMYKLATRLRR
jgi:hypothetical protein